MYMTKTAKSCKACKHELYEFQHEDYKCALAGNKPKTQPAVPFPEAEEEKKWSFKEEAKKVAEGNVTPWYYYLHTNGSIIGKNPAVVNKGYFDSPFVTKVWYVKDKETVDKFIKELKMFKGSHPIQWENIRAKLMSGGVL